MTAPVQQKFENRRTIYALNSQLPVSKQKVIDTVEHAILHTPSAFNSQSTRIIVLFDDAHKRLWDIAENNLRTIMGDADFSATAQKMESFRAGAGTVLFFEDDNDIKGLQEGFPLYADNFPVWAEHTNAMHQYAIWTAFRDLDIGASLQHYAPIFEEDVAREFDIPANWKMIAQMPFGGIGAPAGEKEYKPVAERLRVLGN